MKFDQYNFDSSIKQNLEALGFKKPTDIQFKSIPSIMKGEDVLAIAQTGTGKTAAFAIPIIDMIKTQKRRDVAKYTRAVVMVPTHELAMQIERVFKEIGKDTDVWPLAVIGGVDQAPQIEKLKKGVDVVIGTPGRMFDLAAQGHLKLDDIQFLILDEADHMLDLGFYKDIRDMIFKTPRTRQTLFFSATINEKIKDLAYSIVRNPIRIQVSPKNPVNKNITHSLAYIEMDDKRFFLERVVNENTEAKIIVFVRTKVRAERVALAMKRVNIEAETIHSDKEQEERTRVMKDFGEGKLKILIATDVSARGVDIPNVDFVVNYDLPDVAENYVHRIGRTGRGMNKGIAVSFCASSEIEFLKAIETYIGVPISVIELDKEEYKKTIDFSETPENEDWQSLINESEKQLEKAKKKKGQKKNKKRTK
ncbi:MAG: DEAD/DEAH box helicase [Salibacteraceae bacterium]|nr:DEAD/DEAH box helicase [Salibacteraceae bacterium]